MILVGDLNVAPLEHDVWSHKQMLRVVSHTPIECEKLTAVQKAGGWVDAMRMLVPEPAKLYTWWSYRSPDWETADKGRRLDHIWVAPALADRVADLRDPEKFARLDAALRPRAGDGDAGAVEELSRRSLRAWQSLRLVRVEHPAHIVDFARRLIGARRQDVAQLARRVREAFQHLEEQGARNAQHGRRLERRRGGRTRGLGEQRELAEQRARPDRDTLAVLGRATTG